MKAIMVSVSIMVFAAIVGSMPASAASRFIGGVSDGLRTYAIIERNGVEYRTDETGANFNKGLWSELSSADRKALIKSYGWQTNRRRSDFGIDGSNAMADWINEEQGWTAAIDSLKQRRANKDFPALSAVFGPTATFDIPPLYCSDPVIVTSSTYQTAVQVAKELQADYDIGKQIYSMLVNAKWDQISIAFKTLAEPLIEKIVENFITPFITHGAKAAYSELAAQAYEFAKDFSEFIGDRVNSGAKPPTPIELIARLEKYMDELELTANTAASRVASKKAMLETLNAVLKQSCDDLVDKRTKDAAAVRDNLQSRAASVPPPANLGSFTPRVDSTATDEEKRADIARQADEFVITVRRDIQNAAISKDQEMATVTAKYLSYLDPPTDYYDGRKYLPDAANGFARGYFEITDYIADAEVWKTTSLPAVVSHNDLQKTKIVGVPADTESVFDSNLPTVNDLHAKVLWVDQYADLLGYKPSQFLKYDIAGLRNFGPMIDLNASPGLTLDALAEQLTAASSTANEIKEALPTGISKRQAWMAEEMSRYQSLRFNFENSLSYVIAALRQLDRLHSGPAFKRDPYPLTCFDQTCIYRYSVDIDGLRAAVASKPTLAAMETERMATVKQLIALRAEEGHLLQKLKIAQDSHVNDARAIEDFFASVMSRFSTYPTYAALIAEFAKYAPGTMKSQYDLWYDLVPDITYYYLGDGSSWIRNVDNLVTGLGSAIELVSGKTAEYTQLLDLYNSMRTDKARYLSMTLAEFNAFMTDVTTKIGTYPTGTWISRMQMDGVWGLEWPSWQLVMKTLWLQEELNTEYRGYGTPVPVAWDVSGRITTGGGAAPGVRALNAVQTTGATGLRGIGVQLSSLDGHQTASTTTNSDGSFVFTWVGNGDFRMTVSGDGYDFAASTLPVTINGTDAQVAFVASETSTSGYSVAGSVTDASRSALAGIQMALIPSTGPEKIAISGPDGRYLFQAVPAGSYAIRPVDAGWTFEPKQQGVSLPLATPGPDFVGVPAVPSSNVDVVVKLSGAGSGRVTSQPSLIDCPGACYDSVAAGTTLTLTARANEGSRFAGWFGRCEGAGDCLLTMDDIRTVTAAFEPVGTPDQQAPSIDVFNLPTTADQLVVPVTFTASDAVGVTGYLVTTDTAQPAVSDPRWRNTAPGSFTFSGPGAHILFGWAKDAAGNVSNASSAIVNITVTERPVSATLSTLVANTTAVAADGIESATVTVTLKDADGRALADKSVVLDQGAGSSVVSPASATTDAAGIAVFVVRNTLEESVAYSATANGVAVAQTATVTFVRRVSANQSSIETSPGRVKADGAAVAVVTVHLKDGRGMNMVGRSVALDQGAGASIIAPPVATSDDAGIATFRVRNGKAETVTYGATAEGVRISASAPVEFFRPISGRKSGVTGSPAAVVAEAGHTALITVLARDAGGIPVRGSVVTLTQGRKTSSVAPAFATTDSSGVATFTVSDAQAETVVYKAIADGVSISAKATVRFVVPISAGKSLVKADLSRVAADGVSLSTIRVFLKDGAGYPAPGKVVSLAQGSALSVVSPGAAETDDEGIATFTVMNTKPETVTYQVVSGGVKLTKKARVAFLGVR